MVTKKELKKKIEKYKEEIAELGSEGPEQDRSRVRTFRKRLKRTQRKLSAVVRKEESVAAKGKAGKRG